MQYPATFTLNPKTGCYFVEFRDIPEALTQGYSIEEATKEAKDALITAMDFYFENNRHIPMPSPIQEGDHVIDLPLSIWSKILLLNTMLEQNVNQSELARRLHIQRQAVQRLVDLSYTTKIDAVIDALKVLGKHPVLSIA
ncbi:MULTISPECIES: type II toxin-antitoxin system HicB family antitoxin [Acinetobacter calcoaceticus/baumannii complex]|uniref:type II toxin-antitoxin system HicB family antitoxin n=1 Tax=Acinetobacter calcoaceticus/baumannii complex TaxID=909768 RepID=UPI001950B8DD|nr:MULTISPECIES: type II toxin-antitoxin system HicB family antitoxin [Acinetobacter calcoaceticus/baumannii complex]MDV4239008.1 type II toxin-antitoxin system HicB family antitoxin [Acinetobacter baumannii]MDX8157840.1 type II toxin-antitoxin system HicB family antitoxin [Acinetobacter pittii]QRO95034.1 type II toxin-antitoxin system HicB family antitoxin [Acinetobacter pittii]